MSARPEFKSEPPLLELSGVVLADPRRAYGHVEAINWRVVAGDYWVIGGVPAAGKSDFLATAAGLQVPAQGRQFLFGQDLARMAEDQLLCARRRVGLVFANGGRLFNHFTVAENVALPLCYHRNCPASEVWEPVQAILELTGLAALAHNTPGLIGRGWRQRAALARALAIKPEVLLLDDPTGGLDARQSHWWFELLASLAAGHPLLDGKKMTLVVAVGNLRPWVEYARQFALLQPGRLLSMGGRAELDTSTEPLLHELLGTELTHLKT